MFRKRTLVNNKICKVVEIDDNIKIKINDNNVKYILLPLCYTKYQGDSFFISDCKVGDVYENKIMISENFKIEISLPSNYSNYLQKLSYHYINGIFEGYSDNFIDEISNFVTSNYNQFMKSEGYLVIEENIRKETLTDIKLPFYYSTQKDDDGYNLESNYYKYDGRELTHIMLGYDNTFSMRINSVSNLNIKLDRVEHITENEFNEVLSKVLERIKKSKNIVINKI